MKYPFLVSLVFFYATTVLGQKTLDALLQKHNTQSIPYISVEQLHMLQLNNDLVILDTRELEEFETSHIASATHVGFNTFSVEEISEENISKDAPIVVYCSLGIRSEEIGEKLKKAGFKNIQNLYGGIFEWKNTSYPVFNKKEIETDSVHTFSKAWSTWLDKGIKVYK